MATKGIVGERQPANLWWEAWRRLTRNRAAMVGLAIVLLLTIVASGADYIAPYPPAKQSYAVVFQPPSAAHWMGTDQLGRDLLSRLIHGTRASLSVGLLVQLIVLGIGLPIGLIAGYLGGRIDNLLMRATDVMYAFPDLLFIIILTTWLGRGLDKIFLAIGLVVWTDMARLVRGQTLALREREFVEAARAVGVPGAKIVLRYILPNALSPIIVAVTLGIPRAIIAESALSFIGIGLQPPNASWGTLVQDGYGSIFAASYLTAIPALAIAVTMLSFTFLGDGLRDALDPRMR